MQDYTSYDIHTHTLHYIIVLMEKSCDVLHTHMSLWCQYVNYT